MFAGESDIYTQVKSKRRSGKNKCDMWGFVSRRSIVNMGWELNSWKTTSATNTSSLPFSLLTTNDQQYVCHLRKQLLTSTILEGGWWVLLLCLFAVIELVSTCSKVVIESEIHTGHRLYENNFVRRRGNLWQYLINSMLVSNITYHWRTSMFIKIAIVSKV